MPYTGSNSQTDLKKDKTPILLDYCSHGMTSSLKPFYTKAKKIHWLLSSYVQINPGEIN